MVVDWEQETGLLMSSGDVRIVRIWDTDREMKVQVTAAPPGLRLCSPPPDRPLSRRSESGGRGPSHRQALMTSRPIYRDTLTLYHSVIKPMLILIVSKSILSMQIRDYQEAAE